jgi:hypothetical protein
MAPAATMITRSVPAFGIVVLSMLAAPATTDTSPKAISGTVQLTARLYDELGKPTGERTVADADGVRVRLHRPGGSTDATVTQRGRYAFAAGPAGRYGASWALVPETEVTTLEVQVEAAAPGDLGMLTLGPFGDVRTYPNPIGATGLSIEFDGSSGEQVEVTAYTVAGERVWRHTQEGVQGLNHIHWMATNDSRTPVPAGAYWVVARGAGRHHYNLVFTR